MKYELEEGELKERKPINSFATYWTLKKGSFCSYSSDLATYSYRTD